MGRVGRRFAGIRFTSRLTWSVSVRTQLGRERRRGLRPAPAAAAGRRVSVALVRAALAAARPRPLAPPPPRAAHRRLPRPPLPLLLPLRRR